MSRLKNSIVTEILSKKQTSINIYGFNIIFNRRMDRLHHQFIYGRFTHSMSTLLKSI